VTARFRCSVAAADQPMAGSAAHDRAFLCIEHPGPWGRKAVQESRWLPEHVREALAARTDVRVQLIRRHGRAVSEGGFRVFLAHAGPDAPWTEATRLDDHEQLLDLDLDALADGRRTGLPPHEEPLVLVCTNGRRDACCAEFGRPLAAGLSLAHPDLVWETTHVGGHRFAGAVLVLPHGLSYGRVDLAAGLRIAELSREGRLDPAHLRGRSAYPPAVQAAEAELLARLGEDRVDALELASHAVDGASTTVTFRAGDATHVLEVEAVPGAPLRQSCADETPKPATSHVVRGIRPW
jgi:hypothetical protein